MFILLFLWPLVQGGIDQVPTNFNFAAALNLKWTVTSHSDCTLTSYLGELNVPDWTSLNAVIPNSPPVSYSSNEWYQAIRLQNGDIAAVLGSNTVQYQAKTFHLEGGDSIQTGIDYLTLSCTGNGATEAKSTLVGINGAVVPVACPEVSSKPCNDRGNCHPYTGICTCVPPYYSSDCSKIDCGLCFNSATCIDSTGICSCLSGYSGDHCEFVACPSDCNNQGDCDRFSGICTCHEGYIGISCSETLCLNDCNSNGRCDTSSGTCSCYEQFFGTDCAYKECVRDCGAYGGCNHVTGECKCFSGYAQDDCMFSTCPGDCNSNGNCDPYSGLCDCFTGFVGVDCSTAV